MQLLRQQFFSISSSYCYFSSSKSLVISVDFSVTRILSVDWSCLSSRGVKTSPERRFKLNWWVWTHLPVYKHRLNTLLCGALFDWRWDIHSDRFQSGGTQVQSKWKRTFFNFPFVALWQIMTDEAKMGTGLAPHWQRPPSSTCQCQVTISQVPPSIT